MVDEKIMTPGRERLILAGIKDLEKSGVKAFSIRRAAANCGVSCAAPYKHFKSKDALVLAILRYYKNLWHEKQLIIAEEQQDLAERLTEISIAYVRFCVNNPAFLSLITTKDDSDSADLSREKAQITEFSFETVNKYCESVNMPNDIKVAKLFVIRSLIYGAALMISNGEIPNTPATFNMIKTAIAREFVIDFGIPKKD